MPSVSDQKAQPPPIQRKTGRGGLIGKFLFDRTKAKQPSGAIPVQAIAPPALEAARAGDETHLYRLGHSTLLMKFGAVYWLVDPVFSLRASPSRWVGPKRFQAPPLALADVPKIACLLISHNHYDHLDRATIRAPIGRVAQYVVPVGVAVNPWWAEIQ